MIRINGARGEGGGQVLRSALTLSLISKQSIHITNIRAQRPNPGLAPQHLTGLLAAAHIGQAEVKGDRLHATDVIFEPGAEIKSGRFRFDVSQQSKGGSAGSVSLILQTILLPLLLASKPSQLELHGGTHVPGSPPYNYLEAIYLELLRTLGAEVSSSLQAWGFYPAGGGRIVVHINPLPAVNSKHGRLRALNMIERLDVLCVKGQAIAANLPAHIAQRMSDRATKLLERQGIQVDIRPLRVRSRGPGAGIFLVSQYENGRAGFSGLGRKGKPSEIVAEEAVEQLLAHHESRQPVDPHLADQLMLPLLLAGEPSIFCTSQVTGHQQTNAELINLFYPDSVKIRVLEDGTGEVLINPLDSISLA